MIAAALTASYAAFVALYHSSERRAARWLKQRLPSAGLNALRWGGLVLLTLALVLCIELVGVGRGITIWLGLLSVAAAMSLVCAALRPRWHWPSVVAATLLATVIEGTRYWL